MMPGPFPGDVNDYLGHELDAGAYMLGGTHLQIEVEGRRNEEIILYDVRPLVPAIKCPPGRSQRSAARTVRPSR